ncbi:MAG: T9SS type A sorting domain-containing protein [Bacteroidota bacterium]
MKIRLLLSALAVLAIGLAPSIPALAQQTAAPPAVHILKDGGRDADTRVLPIAVAGKNAEASATIEVEYIGFSNEARAAFQHAVDIWEAHIASPLPIRIRAEWVAIPSDPGDPRVTLGAAGPSTFYSVQSFPFQQTWYPVGLAHALYHDAFGTRISDAPDHDISAIFNSEVTFWYFGTDGQTPRGRTDFVSVVLHEIGHGLGFVDSFRIDDGDDENGETCPGTSIGAGCWGFRPSAGGDPLPVLLDQFLEDDQGRSLIATSVYPNPSRSLADVLQSDAVFFSGTSTLEAYDNLPLNLYAPNSFEPGSSIAHLDEETFPPGDPNSLMTPFLDRAEAIHSPGGLFCAVLQDMGWQLGDGCFALLSAELTMFAAERISAADGRVLLEWTTLEQADLVEFVVERQYYDEEFEPLEVIPFQEGVRDYSYELSGLDPGQYTFRIRYERPDGTSALSRPQEVVIPLLDQVIVQAPVPNPFRTSTSVLVQVRRTQRIDAELYDATGRRVQTVATNVRVEAHDRIRLEVRAADLGSGVYFLHVVGSEFSTSVPVVLTR